MQQVIFRFWQSTPKTGFGLGFVTGGLFMGLVALALLGAGSAHAHDFKQGDVLIDHPYATPSLAGTTNGAVYFKGIQNKGKEADQLLSAKSQVADKVEIHEMTMSGDVMKMRPLSSIEIPAGGEVSVAK